MRGNSVEGAKKSKNVNLVLCSALVATSSFVNCDGYTCSRWDHAQHIFVPFLQF